MFKKGDVDGILPLIVEYRKHYHKINVDETIIENTRKILLSMVDHKDSFVFVSELDSHIVGYMVLHFCPFPLLGSNEVYVTDILVKPERRCKGVGRALIEKAKDFGKKHKCNRLMLNNNKTAESYIRSFYTKIGFEERVGFANFVYNLDQPYK
jgi:GNAT superfamily N-acetyltransferase